MRIILARSVNDCPLCHVNLYGWRRSGEYWGGYCPDCGALVEWPVMWWQDRLNLSRTVEVQVKNAA